MTDPELDRFQGALLGRAASDAVGTTVEFMSPGTFEPVTDMVGGGPFGLKAGEWTDDTSMALCLADSLIGRRGFDPLDQMARYVRWWRTGYRSSTGKCFDIGNTTSDALDRFERTGEPIAGRTDSFSAGNGSLMRLAPVPMAYSLDVATAAEMSGLSSTTTHGAREAVDACRYFGGLVALALSGATKSDLLDPSVTAMSGALNIAGLAPKVSSVACGSFAVKSPPDIRGTGYVVDCLEAALWAFNSTDDFEAGCLAAVNLGHDADTTAAVYGQIAGAYYGASGIPDHWLERLHESEEIRALAAELYSLARSGDGPSRGKY